MTNSVNLELWHSIAQFAKGTCLDSPSAVSAVLATETADCLPQAPQRNKLNEVAYATIDRHPELFRIVTPIKVDKFKEYLRDHPNQAYVDSVCRGLREGFWPWAKSDDPALWETYDNSHRPIRQPDHMAFVREQRDEEIKLGRWSASFGSQLLPGMYSSPIGVVPKPHSDKFRLVNDHSQKPYSPNSSITDTEPSFPLDTIADLIDVLLDARKEHGENRKLVLWKSDLTDNIMSTDAIRLGAVLVVKKIGDLLGYVDDDFSWDFAGKTRYYEPYAKYLPEKQARYLELWDELGIPHDKEKQEFGSPLTIIGFEVDPNGVKVGLTDSRRCEIFQAIDAFAQEGQKRTFLEFQQIAGLIQWALTANPFGRPGLSGIREVMSVKRGPQELIPVSVRVCRELRWLKDHFKSNDGGTSVGHLKAWGGKNDHISYSDACPSGLGIWIPSLHRGLQAKTSGQELSKFGGRDILDFEAFAILAAFHYAATFLRPTNLAIYSDSLASVKMFDSLSTRDEYRNNLLTAFVDIKKKSGIWCRVFHISGDDNKVADALSRFENHRLEMANMTVEKLELLVLFDGKRAPVLVLMYSNLQRGDHSSNSGQNCGRCPLLRSSLSMIPHSSNHPTMVICLSSIQPFWQSHYPPDLGRVQEHAGHEDGHSISSTMDQRLIGQSHKLVLQGDVEGGVDLTAFHSSFQPALHSTSEQTPLLIPSQTSGTGTGRSRSRSQEPPRFSPATLIIPIAIICRFAIMLVTTTSFRVIQIFSCQLWYWTYDPSKIPLDGQMPDALCKIPAVQKYFAAVSILFSLCDGIGVVIGSGAVSFFASRLGRKPVLLGIIMINVVGQVLIIGKQFVRGWPRLEASLFALWVVSSSISNPLTTIFVLNMYIVDVVQAEDRTAALSKVGGWSTLGGAIALSLGGIITTQSDSVIIVFLVSTIALALLCIYISIFLPESFPIEKRVELRRKRNELLLPGSQTWTKNLTSSLAVVFEPLKQLKPSYDPSKGRRNWRLVFCAIHVFIVTVADGYAALAMVLYFTTHYKYTTAKVGYILTTYNVTGVVVLTFVIPAIVRHLKPLYERKRAPAISSPEDATLNDTTSDSSSQLDEIDESSEQVVSETSDHLDVHITVGSWIVESAAYIFVGTATTLGTQLAGVVCIGLGAGRTPVFRSLVVASSEPLKQGEALAAIEMISSLGLLLSPIVMGSIATATITTAPQTIFYVHAAIIAFGASVLFFIRDSDRYQKPT
ncbi:MFS general substrate transporter [Phlegmacium glaucopus]|nr:MFS general substrate transporter [Phlegmacium glaucopus]